jgi:hypothetical protein
MRSISAPRILGGLICVLAAHGAFAVPVQYQFTTGTAAYTTVASPGGDPLLLPLPVNPNLAELAGLSVSGTFDYDNATAATATDTGPLLPTLPSTKDSTIYGGAFTNLSGTIGTYAFSDPTGTAIVGDEKFIAFVPPIPNPPPPLPPEDFLQLTTAVLLGETPDITGFSIGDFRLISARIFWIEGYTPPATPDFLTSNDLLASPPDFSGRLALDFAKGSVADLSTFQVATYFVDDVRITPVPTPVPEPTTLALLGVGVLLLGAVRYRRERNRPQDPGATGRRE